MEIDSNEEKGSSVGVCIPEKPAIVHVPHNVFHRGEGQIYVRGIMHGQKNASEQLNRQEKKSHSPKDVHVGLVTWHRVIHGVVIENSEVLIFLPTRTHERKERNNGRGRPNDPPETLSLPFPFEKKIYPQEGP
jgi:hypothetical protein